MFKKRKYKSSINLHKNSSKEMVGYLKLGSCKKILGKEPYSKTIEKKHRVAHITAIIIIALGLFFVLF